MDPSEGQDKPNTTKISRLPLASASSHGLTERSDAQENSTTTTTTAIPVLATARQTRSQTNSAKTFGQLQTTAGTKRKAPDDEAAKNSSKRPFIARTTPALHGLGNGKTIPEASGFAGSSTIDASSKFGASSKIHRKQIVPPTIVSKSIAPTPRSSSRLFGTRSVSHNIPGPYGQTARSDSNVSRPRTAQGHQGLDDERAQTSQSAQRLCDVKPTSPLNNASPWTKSTKQGDHPTPKVGAKSKIPMMGNLSTISMVQVAFTADRYFDHDSDIKEMRKVLGQLNKGNSDKEAAMARATQLEARCDDLMTRYESLTAERDSLKEECHQRRRDADELRFNHKCEIDEVQRCHRHEVEQLNREHAEAIDKERREMNLKHQEELSKQQEQLERKLLAELSAQHRSELETERRNYDMKILEMKTEYRSDCETRGLALQSKDSELGEARLQLERLRADLQSKENELSEARLRIEGLRADLQSKDGGLSEEKMRNVRLETEVETERAIKISLQARVDSLKSHIEFLESDSKAQSDSFCNMEDRLRQALAAADAAREQLIKEETERRVLFNKYQELKGNIRVMCRVRPVIDASEGPEAKMTFPDEKTSAEIVLAGPEEKSSLGMITRKSYAFEFDRVFTPNIDNEEIFGEISMLVQSALDGFNVCIFCYGQTGSGKTFTMSSDDGVIPRATHMIYTAMTKLREKSWQYSMEGSFVEVYNEEINDLLAPGERLTDGKAKKIEIRHDEARRTTTLLNCRSVSLDSEESVENIIREAQSNRSVAATKANERSSRSHSVYILKLVGDNAATGERCEGTLNLVDLAGSERLKQSQAEGERRKETQNINKSLSCLGDVIEALGKGSAHVPYRNSKLTHLLQYSLSGNSKTLMFVMVSPLEAHVRETITSLRFATKVHNTHIGTAKATKKTTIKGES